MLDDAQRYRGLGLSVIPVDRQKIPLVKWEAYQQAPASAEQIDQWWHQWPDANIGIVTGAVSGVVVFDADGSEGLASLRSLNTPATTWLSRTDRPEGGWHQFLRHPGPRVTIGNRAGLRPHLDVRGDGGYIVAPRSLHASGNHYEWLTSPQDVPLASLPEDLLALLTAPPGATKPGTAGRTTARPG